ncbi:proline-rich extensin-like protein EPR1 isoform X2 [Nematostella vectensis]|uniref:proline-rich extensin-like protein EPR1 isoform X2 n=1 Tax=Nematostella vectensis TaxID=45351 RepID=UPI0020779765|nr:proline-rich extensin-like protein EPR1 isoform X2 [Nematostella vectensis]
MRLLAFALLCIALARADDDFLSFDPTTDDVSHHKQKHHDSIADHKSNDLDNSFEETNNVPSENSDFSEGNEYVDPDRLDSPAKSAFNADNVAKDVLKYMNMFRGMHAASPLQLSATLSLGAKAHAAKLAKAGKAVPDKNVKHNQTVCGIMKSPMDASRDCVGLWYAKIMNYDWAHKKLNKDNQDFVNLVFRKTQEVGLGVSKGPKGKIYVVAFYEPLALEKDLVQNVLPYTDIYEADEGVKCNPGYTEYQGSCYKRHTDKKTWMGGVVECAKEGAILTDISDAMQETTLKGLKGKDNKDKLAWVGLNDRIKESIYSYVGGNPIEHLNWKTGEPQGKGQNCVALDFSSTLGTFFDKKCTEKHEFICKKALKGYVLYQVKMHLAEVSYIDDFSKPQSLAFQEMKKKIEDSIKAIYKDDKTMVLKAIHVLELSKTAVKPPSPYPLAASTPYGAPPNPYGTSFQYGMQPQPQYGMPHMMGKREVTPTGTVAPTRPTTYTAGPTSSTDDESDEDMESMDDETFEDKAKKAAPKKKKGTYLTLVLKFGPKDKKNPVLDSNPVQKIKDALKKNKSKLPAPLKSAAKVLSVKLLPPGSEPSTELICPTVCASTCTTACSPTCCFQTPSYTPYSACYGASPCAPPTPKPPKMMKFSVQRGPRPHFHVPNWAPPPKPVKPVSAPCTPTMFNPCTTPYGYGSTMSSPYSMGSTYGIVASPYSTGYAAPCTPTPANPCNTPAAASQRRPAPGRAPVRRPAQQRVNLPGYTSPYGASPYGAAYGKKKSVVPKRQTRQCISYPCGPQQMMPQQMMPQQMMPQQMMPQQMMPQQMMPQQMMPPMMPMMNPYMANPLMQLQQYKKIPQMLPLKKEARKPIPKQAAALCVPTPYNPCTPQVGMMAPQMQMAPQMMALPMPMAPQMPMMAPPMMGPQMPCAPGMTFGPCARRSPQRPVTKSKTLHPKKNKANDPANLAAQHLGTSYSYGSTSNGSPYGTTSSYGSSPYGSTYGSPYGSQYGSTYGSSYDTGCGSTGCGNMGVVKHIRYNINPPVQPMPFNPYGSSYGSALPSPIGMPLIPGMTYPKCLPNPSNPCKPLKFKTPKFKSIRIKLKDAPIEIRIPQNPNLASLMQFPLSNSQCPSMCQSMPVTACPATCAKRCCTSRG